MLQSFVKNQTFHSIHVILHQNNRRFVNDNDIYDDLNLNQIGETDFSVANTLFPNNILSFKNPSPEQKIYKNMERFIQGNEVINRKMLLQEELACISELRHQFWKRNKSEQGYFELNDFFEQFASIQHIKGDTPTMSAEKMVRLLVERFGKFKVFKDTKRLQNKENLTGTERVNMKRTEVRSNRSEQKTKGAGGLEDAE